MTDGTQEPAVPPAKVDPETLAIRTQPARAIRFRRGVIIGIAALGSVSLTVVAWLALEPQIVTQVMRPGELSEPDTRTSADTLEQLPASYGDVPRLGPPLPGDLGRPILRAQQTMATEDGQGGEPPMVDAAAAARQQRLAEARAARESGVLVALGSSAQAAPAAMPATPALPEMTGATDSSATIDVVRDPNGQQRKAAFVAAEDRGGDINPHSLSQPASPYLLAAGSVIAASLITGLNSDLPGLVTAQVTAHVYDSATGTILLIPQGARLIGRYDSVVAFGQSRALIIWQRLLLPDGRSLRIDNMPATDGAGFAGLADKVDYHSWRLLKGVGVATLLGVGSQLSITGESDLVEVIRQSTQTNVARAGDQLTARNLDIQPTITIRPGAPVRLVVHKDLILAPWTGVR